MAVLVQGHRVTMQHQHLPGEEGHRVTVHHHQLAGEKRHRVVEVAQEVQLHRPNNHNLQPMLV